MKIKICGLTSTKEAEYLNDNNVDFAGMVMFFPKSKRNINEDKATEIINALDKSIKKVAVTVSPTLEQVKIIEKLGGRISINSDCHGTTFTINIVFPWGVENKKSIITDDIDLARKLLFESKSSNLIFLYLKWIERIFR